MLRRGFNELAMVGNRGVNQHRVRLLFRQHFFKVVVSRHRFQVILLDVLLHQFLLRLVDRDQFRARNRRHHVQQSVRVAVHQSNNRHTNRRFLLPRNTPTRTKHRRGNHGKC